MILGLLASLWKVIVLPILQVAYVLRELFICRGWANTVALRETISQSDWVWTFPNKGDIDRNDHKE